MKRAIILLLIAVFGFTTLLPLTASAATTTRSARFGGTRTVHVSVHPGGKHKKHKKHKKHHKRRKHRGKHKRNARKK